jgi:hypothetical protein
VKQTKQTAAIKVTLPRVDLVELRRLAARTTLWSGWTMTVSAIFRELVTREPARPEVTYAGV